MSEVLPVVYVVVGAVLAVRLVVYYERNRRPPRLPPERK